MNKFQILILPTIFIIESCILFLPTQQTSTVVTSTLSSHETLTPSRTFAPSPTSTRNFIPTSSPRLTPALTTFPHPTRIITDNNVEMVLIPAGDFIMGNDDGPDYEKPAHTVYLDVFYMDIYETTNREYENCVNAGICQPPIYNGSNSRSSYYENPQYDNYPVIYVNWDMAKTYCEWRGAELPTEAQWEKAARGTNGRTYPWGEKVPDCSIANYWSLASGICVGDTTSVGNYESGKSPYGIYDMAGNVWEWVLDWYSEMYYHDSPVANPLGPDSGQDRTVRGGAWLGDYPFLQASSRHSESYWQQGFVDVGFRCSRTLP